MAGERDAWTPKPASGIPAKGTRPPFELGNRASLQHGARSPRVYGPLAEELAAGIVAERPHLARYPEAVAAWAQAEAQASLLRGWIAEHGWTDADGAPRDGQLRWLTSFESRADKARQRLGLDPKADADLARAQADATLSAVDLASVQAAGREALERRGDVEVLDTGHDRDDAEDDHGGR